VAYIDIARPQQPTARTTEQTTSMQLQPRKPTTTSNTPGIEQQRTAFRQRQFEGDEVLKPIC